MKKMKVYLAKSNKANPDVVARVRQTLSNYNLEIVEFKGGTYTHKPLLECDQMVIVPAEVDVCEDFTVIGKGLYEQIEAFSRKSLHNSDNIIVITSDDCDTSMVEGTAEIDEDDYVNYAELHLSEDGCSLKEVLDDIVRDYYMDSDEPIYASESTSVRKTNSNYYLLIGKKF